MAGVTSVGPEPFDAVVRRVEVRVRGAAVGPRRPAPGSVKVPSAPRGGRARPPCRPCTASTLMPLQRLLPGSMTPGVPPPPWVKSSQTVPVTLPAAGLRGLRGRGRRAAACRRRRRPAAAARACPACTGPRRGERAAAAGLQRRGRARMRARDRRPTSANVSCTPDHDRVGDAPRRVLLVHQPEDDARGEHRDRHRHEDEQLERRSPAHPFGQHGEDQAERGGDVGATTTQIALFFTAVRIGGSVNSVL